MNAKEFTDKWGQFTSGSELTETEIVAMERLMETDAVLRAEVADDHRVHRVLQSMGTIHESQDEFVTGVLEACTGVDNPFAPLLGNSAGSEKRVGRKLVAVLSLTAIATVGCLAFMFYSQLNRARVQADQAMRVASQAQQHAERAAELSSRQASIAVPEDVEQKEPPLPEAVVEPEFVGETLAGITGDEASGTWRGNVDGRKLVAGNFELVSGEAILRTTGGSIVSVRSGTRFTLHHATHLTLQEGEIEVQVAVEDIGFRVSTPNSRVIDLGTTFQVSVNNQGRTRVRLDVGEVVVVPWQSGPSAERQHLRVGEYEEMVVYGSGDGVEGLLAGHSSGPAGFQGSIRLGDTSFELTSIDRFDHVYETISASYDADPIKTKAAWLRARKILERVSGRLSVGGREALSFNNLDSLLKTEQEVMRSSSMWEANRLGGDSISGAFSVAGKDHRFDSHDEYKEVRQRIFEPLEALGIRPFGVPKSRRQSNPFRRR